MPLYTKLKSIFRKRKKVLVLGDSHAEIFKDITFNTGFEKFNFHLCSVPGATISGLSNPNSKTQALPIFEEQYKKIRPDVTIFQLGEVDVGFVIWFRHEKYKVSVDELLIQTIENYKKLILSAPGDIKTVIISAPLPTIKDNQSWGEVANLRKEINANREQRTLLTLRFNQLMCQWASDLGLTYLNLDEKCLSSDGFVADFLLNSNPHDHHYESKPYAKLIKDYLLRTLN